MENLGRFATLGDSDGAETIWTCCIMCLAHLAALSHLMSQADPASSVSMNRVYDLTLDELGNLSIEARIDGYTHLDILIGVCIL